MNKAIRKYDIAEYAEKGGNAIDNMMATQQAGKLVKGSKYDVCVAMREKLKVALDAGFTLKQIAEALKDGDVFGVLPKMISEALKDGKVLGVLPTATVEIAKKPRTGRKTKAGEEHAELPNSAIVVNEAGGKFNIQPDKKAI